MDLRALRVVAAVAEHGSVTRAARSLHQSSSAVSRTLVSLETELGVDLFHRLPRGMTLTDAGESFAFAARRALHEAEVARRSVDAIRGLVSGRVTIGAALGLSVALAALVGDFARRYAHLMVRVVAPETADGVAELVRSGACDVGFTWADTVADDLDAVPVFVDQGVVVVPERHRLAGRRSVCMADLHEERMVAPLSTSTMRPVFDDIFRRQGVEPKIVAEAATNEMVLELVSVGVGSTVTFASSAAPVHGRGALVLTITDELPRRFLLITRSGQTPTPAAQAFVDLAVQRFAHDPSALIAFARADDSPARQPKASMSPALRSEVR